MNKKQRHPIQPAPELLPCPYCGGLPYDVPQNNGWILRCGNCEARMVDEYSRANCYAAWNRRVSKHPAWVVKFQEVVALYNAQDRRL